MKRWLARLNPLQLWSRSLPYRVVTSTMLAAVLILMATGWFLTAQSVQGIMAGKTQASVAEASSVVTSMQRDLSATDPRTTSLGERITQLTREAANRGKVGNQYFVVVETSIAQIGTEGVASSSIPDSIRAAAADGDGLWSTPTMIRFTDSRPEEPGLVVASRLVAPGQEPYRIFFLFSTGPGTADPCRGPAGHFGHRPVRDRRTGRDGLPDLAADAAPGP